MCNKLLQIKLAEDVLKKFPTFIPHATLKECVRVKDILEKDGRGVAHEFKKHCKERFVLASIFDSFFLLFAK